MSQTETLYNCLNCGRSETDIPLISLRHAGRQAWICSRCMPTLIHKPFLLVGKLDKADQIPPAPPDSGQ